LDRLKAIREYARNQRTSSNDLIVAHEVTNIGSDRAQLVSMGRKARDATGCQEITALADRGYYNDDEVLACQGAGVLPYIPKTLTARQHRIDQRRCRRQAALEIARAEPLSRRRFQATYRVWPRLAAGLAADYTIESI
jgi:hypothetical protein